MNSIHNLKPDSFCQEPTTGTKIGLKDLPNKQLNGKNAIIKEQLEDGTYKIDVDGEEEIIKKRNITEPYQDVNANSVQLF